MSCIIKIHMELKAVCLLWSLNRFKEIVKMLYMKQEKWKMLTRKLII